MASSSRLGPPQAKKRLQTIKFFYFGRRFYHFEAPVAENDLKLVMTMKEVKVLQQGNSMCEVIQEDMEKLTESKVGGKKWSPNGNFVRLSRDKTVYVYNHTQHAACSKTTVSEIVLTSRVEIRDDEITKCQDQGHTHDELLPYFSDNKALLSKYKGKVKQGDTDSRLKKWIEDLTKIVQNDNTGVGTPFVCSPCPSFAWDDDIWTERLVIGLKSIFKEHRVTFTARLNFRLILSLLEIYVPVDVFMFRGMPDILIGNSAVMTAGDEGSGEEEEGEALDSSGSDVMIENTRQALTLSEGTGLPEKLGQLFAGLHFILVAKILRKLQRRKTVDRIFKVQGLFLDKVCATMDLSLSVNMTAQDTPLEIEAYVNHKFGSILKPNMLCAYIKNSLV